MDMIKKMFETATSKSVVKEPQVGIVLPMLGTELHSLEDLRKSFDMNEVMTAFLNGTLEQWLKNCYYEREYSEVQNLSKDMTEDTKRQLCAALGVEYPGASEQDAKKAGDISRKRSVLEKHTQDVGILSHAAETATNQGELAELLNQGEKTIYLCDGSFSIPIRKGGILYIGVDNPTLSAPFTREQYQKAGITLEGLTPPETSDESTAAVARQAAVAYGYDDFAETHCKLANMVRKGMSCRQFISFPRALSGISLASLDEHRSRSAALRAGRGVVDKAYDKANRFFSPDASDCLASPAAEHYAKVIHRAADMLAQRLQPWCKGDLNRENALRELSRLVEGCEKSLRDKLEDELRDSADYYQMYDRSYFLDRVEVEMFDYAITSTDSGLLNALSSALQNDREYIIVGLTESLDELQKDLSEHAQSFFANAFGIFKDYRGQIEELAEELGKELTDTDLKVLGIAAK